MFEKISGLTGGQNGNMLNMLMPMLTGGGSTGGGQSNNALAQMLPMLMGGGAGGGQSNNALAQMLPMMMGGGQANGGASPDMMNQLKAMMGGGTAAPTQNNGGANGGFSPEMLSQLQSMMAGGGGQMQNNAPIAPAPEPIPVSPAYYASKTARPIDYSKLYPSSGATIAQMPKVAPPPEAFASQPVPSAQPAEAPNNNILNIMQMMQSMRSAQPQAPPTVPQQTPAVPSFAPDRLTERIAPRPIQQSLKTLLSLNSILDEDDT